MVGLRYNYNIPFIATRYKTMALVFYITNYVIKVEDPVWRRVAAVAGPSPYPYPASGKLKGRTLKKV
jgi:hypothetical protein